MKRAVADRWEIVNATDVSAAAAAAGAAASAAIIFLLLLLLLLRLVLTWRPEFLFQRTLLQCIVCVCVCVMMANAHARKFVCIMRRAVGFGMQRGGHTGMHAAAAMNNFDVLKFLIEKGSTINAQDVCFARAASAAQTRQC